MNNSILSILQHYKRWHVNSATNLSTACSFSQKQVLSKPENNKRYTFQETPTSLSLGGTPECQLCVHVSTRCKTFADAEQTGTSEARECSEIPTGIKLSYVGLQSSRLKKSVLRDLRMDSRG
ncbi:hypothetical protein TNIN_465561 [Trichonephila inaurata madagascariensis]|uniref:Uncharacterized protein n=1 Tax=Trichonephila inaurata madagascariensis TaxID=2747483 RepID=A0A8X7C616_9ARAC|nr:hypothetical protein TNIN_465561 [Trichonephila inaurata madagascariensis]